MSPSELKIRMEGILGFVITPFGQDENLVCKVSNFW
jgi:hypothetical protein